ncbi:MAG: hypothetical protein J7L07_00065 [Candidatus Odinarchaeota archaeon]|nr:hypothetical protein [Candidatus Odinarchaeota archaeon]
MKWSFIIDITNIRNEEIPKLVEERARKAVSQVGEASQPSAFKVTITCYLKSDRWQRENPQIPREDVGKYLNKIINLVFDGLGPIIGYRRRWESGEIVGTSGVYYSRIIQITARKVNSGSEKEFLSVEIEKIA